MKSERKEKRLAEVPERAKQAREADARWAWVEPTIWTERMLAALEKGVKGGKWFSLIDKVYGKKNLEAAFKKVKANRGAPGIDHVTIEIFEARLEENLTRLHESLRDGSYRPQAIRRKWIPKGGGKKMRPLGIPTVRDRVAQNAIRNVLEPIFERDFADGSHGFRPKRGCKDALRRVSELLQEGYIYVVEADVKDYYETIVPDRLMKLVEEKVSDGRVLDLLQACLKQEIFEAMKGWTPERGTPQGAVISPLLANIYLNPFDHEIKEKGYEMVRYADDFVILCWSEAEARHALEAVREWMAEAGLGLHPEKTRIVDARERGGFDFLGYHFERGQRWPSRKSIRKLKDKLRPKLKRTNGHSLDTIIADVNRSLIGWFGYYKHSHKRTFRFLDGWIRMRCRSILRKRRGGKGRGRGRDHQRWPNSFFAEHGLFSLTAAHAVACQSARR